MQLTLMFYSFLSFGLFLFMVMGFAFLNGYRKSDHRAINISLFDFSGALVFCICYLAISGIFLISFFADWRGFIAVLLIAVPTVLGIWCVASLIHNRLFTVFLYDRVYVLATCIFTVFILIIANAPIALRDTPDGPYVNKENVNSVRLQKLTGDLPADNVLPFVVQEYLANDISFSSNSPILPGQPVTNRPFLMSLVALPFRIVILPSETKPMNLPKYSYGGQEWPDFRILARNEISYAVFMGIGVFLNAAILLTLGLFANLLWNKKKFDWLLVALFASSSFYIFQTIFLWPKNLAAFFILFSAYLYIVKRSLIWAGVLIGLAYLSHPYALGYLLVGIVFILIEGYQNIAMTFKNLSKFFAAFTLITIPWFIWKQYLIHIPSDMLAQNLLLNGLSFKEFIWVRVVSLSREFLPVQFIASSFSVKGFYIDSSLNLFGAVGSLILLSTLFFPFTNKNQLLIKEPSQGLDYFKKATLYCFTSSILLACIFSYIGVPLVHGAQVLPGLLMIFFVYVFSPFSHIMLTIGWMQVIINMVLLTAYLIKIAQ